MKLRTFDPGTISPEAAKIYSTYMDPTAPAALPGPDDHVAWGKVHAAYEAGVAPMSRKLAERLGVQVDETSLGGIAVLEVTPPGWRETGKRVVYAHGGAYTMLSAGSTLGTAAMVAVETGQKVLSLDYTVAPRARWQAILDEVQAAFAELNAQGFAMNGLAAFGDSAGGGLIGGATLKMRDDGMGLPAAVVLLSPWSDIGEVGDSYTTLKAAEPTYMYETSLAPSALAYAPNAEDHTHPYVSPVYGDFSKGYAPTLIQGGTREIFLSNFVRHYQALDQAGVDVKLDLYEGMPHVFQALGLGIGAPEAQTAAKKIGAFMKHHLGV